MNLPIFISVPHGGLQIPVEIRDICLLTEEDVLLDSDEGALEIYSVLRGEVAGWLDTDVARAAVDLNRKADDIGADGVVKNHTCYGTPVYERFPDHTLISFLLQKYYTPYHEKLRKATHSAQYPLGLDCHTMAAVGPPVGPDSGQQRPLICLSNAENACPLPWLESFAERLRAVFHTEVLINTPFQGGYITRRYGQKMPWMQVEFSRSQAWSWRSKGEGLLTALQLWTKDIGLC